MEHYSIPYVHNTFNKYCELYLSPSHLKIRYTRMSYGTSDTTVISSTKTEARNLNAIDASAASRDDSSPATFPTTSPKNRQVPHNIFSCLIRRRWEDTNNNNKWCPSSSLLSRLQSSQSLITVPLYGCRAKYPSCELSKPSIPPAGVVDGLRYMSDYRWTSQL